MDKGTDGSEVVSGQCLCGAVSYEVHGPLTNLHACHCGQCRRQSGHFVVGVSAKRTDFELKAAETLTWYRSSSWAQRGFCAACGSNLLWDGGGDEIGINVGSLDQPIGQTLTKHIFVDAKPDYYEIDARSEKFAGYDTPL